MRLGLSNVSILFGLEHGDMMLKIAPHERSDGVNMYNNTRIDITYSCQPIDATSEIYGSINIKTINLNRKQLSHHTMLPMIRPICSIFCNVCGDHRYYVELVAKSA